MLTPARADGAALAPAEEAVPARRVPAELWLLGAVTIVGAVLRFATISSQSYWFDESLTAHEMHLSFGGLLHSLSAHEANPPLYFVLAWLWAKMFGTTEAGLRSLSALAGVAVIPIAYLCGRELVSVRAGLVAAALAAISPFMIWYSQEAREYMLVAALTGASLYWFVRTWRSASRRNLTLWALFSSLALLTHFFAGFLIAAEALWLLYRLRSRAAAIAVAAVGVVELSLLPLAFGHASDSLLGYIRDTPLLVRLKQVPITFGLGSLYQSSLVEYGLLAAAVLVGALIVLLVAGAGSRELRGAGLAASLAAFALLLPLLLVALGKDYYLARVLMPAWIPLAVVIGAACTARRAALGGGVLGVVLLGLSVYGYARVQSTSRYQRPDWRGVAASLGSAPAPRAIVAYDGGLARGPLATYLPRIPWTEPGRTVATVSEMDIVGSVFQTPATTLPSGIRLLAVHRVDDFVVERFALDPAWRATLDQIGERARTLLGPAPPQPAVLLQG